MIGFNSVTERQTNYVRVLQKKLHLPDALLDQHCVTRFKKPFAQLTRSDASDLIDELVGWEALPADLVRAKGQLDLIGMESGRC